MLIAAQPTRGLDVGAIEYVHRRLVAERDEGRAILLVSLELEEILSLSDRILVMYEGEIVGEYPPTATEEELGLAMIGGGGEGAGRVSRREPAGSTSPAERRRPRRAFVATRVALGTAGGGIVDADRDRARSPSSWAGIVVVATGKNPLSTYRAIFDGSGLNWLFPWVTGADRADARALNLQQTLIITTPLILTGLAVAFAFRCGMFNIGGQGQYLVGSYLRRLDRLLVRRTWPARLHVVLAIVARALAGAAWAGIAGFLKATVGAHEVISTIMLNWIAIWVGAVPVRPRRAAPERDAVVRPDLERHRRRREAAGLLGRPAAPGALHRDLHRARRARRLLDHPQPDDARLQVRAVGFNPEAARYGGISVSRNYFLAMAISGSFAGLAGALDILGWQFRLSTSDIQASTIGFIGIAVALLGRNTAVGVGLSALLFGALVNGTSTRNLDPAVFHPSSPAT